MMSASILQLQYAAIALNLCSAIAVLGLSNLQCAGARKWGTFVGFLKTVNNSLLFAIASMHIIPDAFVHLHLGPFWYGSQIGGLFLCFGCILGVLLDAIIDELAEVSPGVRGRDTPALASIMASKRSAEIASRSIEMPNDTPPGVAWAQASATFCTAPDHLLLSVQQLPGLRLAEEHVVSEVSGKAAATLLHTRCVDTACAAEDGGHACTGKSPSLLPVAAAADTAGRAPGLWAGAGAAPTVMMLHTTLYCLTQSFCLGITLAFVAERQGMCTIAPAILICEASNLMCYLFVCTHQHGGVQRNALYTIAVVLAFPLSCMGLLLVRGVPAVTQDSSVIDLVITQLLCAAGGVLLSLSIANVVKKPPADILHAATGCVCVGMVLTLAMLGKM